MAEYSAQPINRFDVFIVLFSLSLILAIDQWFLTLLSNLLDLVKDSRTTDLGK
jgi:hypothetical protein